MVGWHYQLNGHEFEQTQGDGEEQGSLACCSPWGCKESDMTELLNKNNNNSNVSNSHTRGKGPLDEGERGERKSWLKAQHSEN